MGEQGFVHAVIRPGDDFGYVAECSELHAFTQGATLDEVAANLREAVSLALAGEDRDALGLVSDPVILVSLELQPAVA